jgi:integrase
MMWVKNSGTSWESLTSGSKVEAGWQPEPVVTLGAWASDWLSRPDVAARTAEQCRALYRQHIGPRWATESVPGISSAAVEAWVRALRSEGYASAVVHEIRQVLSSMLADAVDRGVIEVNPLRWRGRRAVEGWHEPVWASPGEVLALAANAAAVSTTGDGLMILTAAWTGMRWGELAGLHRRNVHVDDARLRVDAQAGVLHESPHRVWLGPPNTLASPRWIALPPFLVELLQWQLASHGAPMVFPDGAGTWRRRSYFSRRVMRPAADGVTAVRAGRVRLRPAKPGLRFHGLRLSHRMWLIEDGVPEIVQAVRLGRALRCWMVPETRLAPEAERRMLERLQARFVVAAESESPSISAFLAAMTGDHERKRSTAA